MFDLENYMRKNLEKLSFEAFKKYLTVEHISQPTKINSILLAINSTSR